MCQVGFIDVCSPSWLRLLDFKILSKIFLSWLDDARVDLGHRGLKTQNLLDEKRENICRDIPRKHKIATIFWSVLTHIELYRLTLNSLDIFWAVRKNHELSGIRIHFGLSGCIFRRPWPQNLLDGTLLGQSQKIKFHLKIANWRDFTTTGIWGKYFSTNPISLISKQKCQRIC